MNINNFARLQLIVLTSVPKDKAQFGSQGEIYFALIKPTQNLF